MRSSFHVLRHALDTTQTGICTLPAPPTRSSRRLVHPTPGRSPPTSFRRGPVACRTYGKITQSATMRADGPCLQALQGRGAGCPRECVVDRLEGAAGRWTRIGARAPAKRSRARRRSDRGRARGVSAAGRTEPRRAVRPTPCARSDLSVQSAGPRPILCPMARTPSAGAIDAERRSGKPPSEGLVAATAIRLVGSVSDDRLDAAEARMRRQRSTFDPGSEGGSHRPARSDGCPSSAGVTRRRHPAAAGPCVPVGGVLL